MIPYFDELLPEEQEKVKNIIQLLQRQTFILERKYEKRQNRFQYSSEFRICSKHLEFIREYFRISGIDVYENTQLGVIYIQGETVIGEKLSRLATLYILILKVIYDEQMMKATTSLHVYTTLGEVGERLGAYGLHSRIAPTEIRRAVTVLKKYQILEPVDAMEDFDGNTRLIIYPTVNLVLLGDDARAILAEIGHEEPEEIGREESTEEIGREETEKPDVGEPDQEVDEEMDWKEEQSEEKKEEQDNDGTEI